VIVDMSTQPTTLSSVEQPIQTSEINSSGISKFNRQDILYLSLLILLVVGMAIRFTPNITGEVPGVWWDPLLNVWTLSWDTTTLLHAPTYLWPAPLLQASRSSFWYPSYQGSASVDGESHLSP
jgi:hypothetical protein